MTVVLSPPNTDPNPAPNPAPNGAAAPNASPGPAPATSAARAATEVYDLVVVGAGPKAAALAAKTEVLRRLGMSGLRGLVLESRSPASHWSGEYGFTSGTETLGTRPEKDIGFPYAGERSFGTPGRAVDEAMLGYSWAAHLVATGRYRQWIDGDCPPVTHRDFADYLTWVFEASAAAMPVRVGTVTALGIEDGRWSVTYEGATGPERVSAAGVVLTGPGEHRSLPTAPEVAQRVLRSDVDRSVLDRVPVPDGVRICVVGVGESAASIALSLLARAPRSARLTFVAPSLVFSRAESFLENSVYSDPDFVLWTSLPPELRERFIQRTDRGVISQGALRRLAAERRVSFAVGRVTRVAAGPDGECVVHAEHQGESRTDPFDLVINCTGYDPLAQLDSLLTDTARARVAEATGAALTGPGRGRRTALPIGPDLALTGLTPRLHLPMLAGPSQGPGFANLSSLGLISDRVLASYLDSPERDPS